MGEKYYCILFNVTFPWLLGEVDFNYTDSQFNHHHLLESTFPLLICNNISINQVIPISINWTLHIQVLRISVLLSYILDIAWLIHWLICEIPNKHIFLAS